MTRIDNFNPPAKAKWRTGCGGTNAVRLRKVEEVEQKKWNADNTD